MLSVTPINTLQSNTQIIAYIPPKQISNISHHISFGRSWSPLIAASRPRCDHEGTSYTLIIGILINNCPTLNEGSTLPLRQNFLKPPSWYNGTNSNFPRSKYGSNSPDSHDGYNFWKWIPKFDFSGSIHSGFQPYCLNDMVSFLVD